MKAVFMITSRCGSILLLPIAGSMVKISIYFNFTIIITTRQYVYIIKITYLNPATPKSMRRLRN